MRVDISLYTIHLKTIQAMLKTHEYEHPTDLTSQIALATGTPVLACLYYIAHLVGMDDKTQGYIDRVTKFYNIKEVLGWPLQEVKTND